MRYLWLLALWGCTKADAAKPAPPKSVALMLQVSGDSVFGGFHWVGVSGITRYRYEITASSGTWLYRFGADSTLRGAFIAKASPGSTAILDSTYFTVCVKSYSATDSSAFTCTVPKRPRRPPAPPPLVIWDSLRIASIQITGSACMVPLLPDSLRWMNYEFNALTCPPVAWFAERRQIIARDTQGCVRTCPFTGSMLDNPVGKYCGWVKLNGNPPAPTCPNA